MVCQISNCSGNLADFIVSTGAWAEFGHRLFEHHSRRRIKVAEFSTYCLCLILALAIILPSAKSAGLNRSGPYNISCYNTSIQLA